MTQEQIQGFLNENPITFNSVRFDFKDLKFKIGFFDSFPDNEELKKSNHWRIVENNNAVNYQATKEIKFTTVIKGDDLQKLTLL